MSVDVEVRQAELDSTLALLAIAADEPRKGKVGPGCVQVGKHFIHDLRTVLREAAEALRALRERVEALEREARLKEREAKVIARLNEEAHHADVDAKIAAERERDEARRALKEIHRLADSAVVFSRCRATIRVLAVRALATDPETNDG